MSQINTTLDEIAQRSLAELACDVALIEAQISAMRRWAPGAASTHLDAALANVSAALDSIHAQHLACSA